MGWKGKKGETVSSQAPTSGLFVVFGGIDFFLLTDYTDWKRVSCNGSSHSSALFEERALFIIKKERWR